jgi:hypothetical protein
MSRTVKGLAIGLAMLVGALALTGAVATSLQHRAEEGHSSPAGFSPANEATVDALGWPVEPPTDRPSDDTGTERSRSRQSPLLGG